MGLEQFQTKSTDTPEQRFNAYLSRKSSRTQQIYRKQMEELCKSPQFDMSIDQIVKFHRNDGEKGDGDTCEKAFVTWTKWAQSDERTVIKRVGREFKEVKQSLSPYTTQGYAKALNAVFIANKLPTIKLDSYAKDNPKAKTMISIDQMRETIKRVPNLEARALIMILKDSGLRISDICQLWVSDFLGAEVLKDANGREFRTWNIATKKSGAVAYICLGYESINAIRDHLAGRTIGHIFDKDSTHLTKEERANNMSKRVRGYTAFLKKDGIKHSAHSFRHTFITRHLNQEIKEINIKMMCGKRVAKDFEGYAHIQNQLLPNYARVYDDALALSVVVDMEQVKEAQITQQDEMQQLKKMMAKLMQDNENLRSHLEDSDNEVERLKSVFLSDYESPFDKKEE